MHFEDLWPQNHAGTGLDGKKVKLWRRLSSRVKSTVESLQHKGQQMHTQSCAIKGTRIISVISPPSSVVSPTRETLTTMKAMQNHQRNPPNHQGKEHECTKSVELFLHCHALIWLYLLACTVATASVAAAATAATIDGSTNATSYLDD